MYPEKINWTYLSGNIGAVYILEQYPEMIKWDWISSNENAIEILKAHPDKINYEQLSINTNIFGIDNKQLCKDIMIKTNQIDIFLL